MKNDPYEDNFIAKTWEIDKKGVLKSDKSTSDKGLYSNAVIFHKEYIINPCYYIKLEVEDELEEEIIKAFTKPVWQIFLGRKNCIPCE